MTSRCILLIAALAAGGCSRSDDTWLYRDDTEHHLGVAGQPEWQEFAGRTPEGRQLDLLFSAETNPAETTLFLRQENVKLRWDVSLNGESLGRLVNQEDALFFTAAIPPGTLLDGDNHLSITPTRTEPDDILIEGIGIDRRPLAEALAEASLDLEVSELPGGEGVPCRITIADERGTLIPVAAPRGQPVAIRRGVIYTGSGRARFTLPAGSYTITATRGFEYGLDQERVSLRPGESRSLKLAIRREVSTPDLVACDPHVHTLELSGHGDSGLDERMYTLAGEGIELPIATEHNQHADYSAAASETGMGAHFTPVIGNEVTTPSGHFNIFPVRAGSPIPDADLTEWPALMESIRSVPDVGVIILNHPRDAHGGFAPFAPENYNAVTGKNKRGAAFTFTAVELVNSGALRSDPMENYRNWFALLNRGYRISGVGSSDSHDVSRSIVGQGRTYIRCPDPDVSKIDAALAAQSLREGRAYVSMGLLTILRVDDRFEAGDLATGLGETIDATVTVHGPSWTTVDLIELYANGVKIGEERLAASSEAGEKARKTWMLPKPRHDVHLVAVASGPGVTAPYWRTPRPYQPTSPKWTPRVLGSNNPVLVDADGDGTFTAARGYAEALVRRHTTDPRRLVPGLDEYDEAIAAQSAELCHDAGKDVRGDAFQEALSSAPEPVRRGFSAFIATLP